MEFYTEIGKENHSEFEEQTALDQIMSGGVVLVILIALVVVWRINKELGGKLKSALSLFVAGVVINLVASFWGSFISHRLPVGNTSFDTHNLFMVLATLFFVLSIRKFALLIPR